MNTNCGPVFPDQDGNRNMDGSDLNPKINSESTIQKHFLESAAGGRAMKGLMRVR